MNIGARVREMRKERGITAKFVAKKIGLSQAMLSEIEREKSGVTVQQVVALADFFGVSTDYLIRGKQ
jgi:transcriptional regulator with XRE-family HTH domain